VQTAFRNNEDAVGHKKIIAAIRGAFSSLQSLVKSSISAWPSRTSHGFGPSLLRADCQFAAALEVKTRKELRTERNTLSLGEDTRARVLQFLSPGESLCAKEGQGL
jgi:hypothetical protein